MLATAARSVVLLGPQPPEGELRAVLAELGVSGPVALVTAGWQERESEDEALVAQLGVAAVNLRLHARSEALFAEDAELHRAYKARQLLLRHQQDFYRVRLDYADDAAHAIAVRHVEPELLEQEWRVSVDVLRQLDNDHIARCRAIHAAFEERFRPAERVAVARHRAELRALVAPTAALVIAGGHVASLFNRLELFDVVPLAAGRHLVAWSAGAMVLTERIVLFHDYPPYGSDLAQLLDAGFGLAPGLVVLPDSRRRIRMEDRAGIGRFAQRLAPSTCLAMDRGARVVFAAGRLIGAKAIRLSASGEADAAWTG